MDKNLAIERARKQLLTKGTIQIGMDPALDGMSFTEFYTRLIDGLPGDLDIRLSKRHSLYLAPEPETLKMRIG